MPRRNKGNEENEGRHLNCEEVIIIQYLTFLSDRVIEGHHPIACRDERQRVTERYSSIQQGHKKADRLEAKVFGRNRDSLSFAEDHSL